MLEMASENAAKKRSKNKPLKYLKIDPRMPPKTPQESPRRPKDASRRPRLRPKRPQDPPKTPQGAPREPQGRPKEPQGRPKIRPEGLQDRIFFLDPPEGRFGLDLGPFGSQFGDAFD